MDTESNILAVKIKGNLNNLENEEPSSKKKVYIFLIFVAQVQ